MRHARSDEGRRGAALVLVLVLMALLSGLAGVALRTGTSGARAAAVFAAGMQADELGQALGDLVLAYVAEGQPDRRRSGSFVVHLTGGEMQVDYESESGRVDANAAPPELIGAVLKAAEIPDVEATLTRIAGFRTSAATRPQGTAGSAGGDPSSGAPPTPAASPGARDRDPLPIQSVADLARAWGLDPGIAARLLPAFTVASRTPRVDPILARGLVLAGLFEGNRDRMADYESKRAAGFVNTDSALLSLPETMKGLVSFEDVPVLRAVGRVALRGGVTRRYEAVVSLKDLSGRTASVLSWRKLF